ncbi:40S ribosomal protein SA-like [Juglans regia]|uniref:40S ribosomal protein SA-like n=1 Tax=Juglans regia TaxID=51240 RepID=A0A6P9F4D9_JUGRE|nr:40S ribosomal protein SA-like [Juglans regia]
MRGTIRPGHKWDVMVDLFFYRESEEAKQQKEEEAVAIPNYGLIDYSAPSLASDQWPVQVADTKWSPHVQHPISAVPTTWATEPVALAAGDWDAAPVPPVTTTVIEGAAALASGWGE